MHNKILAFGGALAAAMIASIAAAQTAAPAAPPPLTQGAPIAGLCVLSVQEAISGSTVGKYAAGRMQQIVAQVKAELAPEDTAIGTESKALETARPTLDQATFQSRAQGLQGRVDALRQKADLRQRELQATERKSFNRIAQELDPIARQLYQQHRCSVLLDKSSTMMTNPEMDITAQAVTALNAKITQFPFDREHLDTGAASAPAR
jgi:Skp family chaperone for outer membrane proteins